MIDRPPALAGIELEQILFGLQGSVGIGELQAVRNAEHVRVDRNAFDYAEPSFSTMFAVFLPTPGSF